MTWVDDLGALRAISAVVPVRAVQALVANTVDELIAAIADGRVAGVPAWRAESMSQCREDSLCRSGLEGMAWVVAVFVADMAVETDVVVFAGSACDKVLLRQN